MTILNEQSGMDTNELEELPLFIWVVLFHVITSMNAIAALLVVEQIRAPNPRMMPSPNSCCSSAEREKSWVTYRFLHNTIFFFRERICMKINQQI
jgi:hypothetical protein